MLRTCENCVGELGRPKCVGKLGLARNIKELIFIRVNNPTLNRNVGKFN